MGCPQHPVPRLLSCLWSEHPVSSGASVGSVGGSGWPPSSTGSPCHQSLTKVPHLQCAQEGWRRPATTVGPAMTKSAARGSATAARSSSGRAASSARPADTARSAEVPRPGGALQGCGTARRAAGEALAWPPCSPADKATGSKSPPRLSGTAERPGLGENISLHSELGDTGVVMDPVQKEHHLGRAQQGSVPM